MQPPFLGKEKQEYDDEANDGPDPFREVIRKPYVRKYRSDETEQHENIT
jgi:hypothetical protein